MAFLHHTVHILPCFNVIIQMTNAHCVYIYTHRHIYTHKLYIHTFSIVNTIQLPSGLYFLRECRKTANYLILSLDPRLLPCQGGGGRNMDRHTIMCIPRLAAALGELRGMGKGEKNLCRTVSLSKDQRE